jgi:VanZ family protein
MSKILKRNIFSILVLLSIMYLSLTSSHTFDKVSFAKMPHIDKFVHFMMYFGLMSVIALENRKIIENTRHLLILSLIPFSYGILMEILQTTLTISRTGNFYDVIFNLIGIITSVLLTLLIASHLNEKKLNRN